VVKRKLLSLATNAAAAAECGMVENVALTLVSEDLTMVPKNAIAATAVGK